MCAKVEVVSGRKAAARFEVGNEGGFIGTHDGKFHADEVLGVALLKFLPRYAEAVVLRTRDTTVLNGCTAVLDVGLVYDPSKLRFDHHIRQCDEKFSEDKMTKLSSAGMIYKHFAKEIFQSVFKTDEALAEMLYERMYENFVEAVDALDNGIAVADPPLRFKIRTDFTTRMSAFNTPWNDFKADENVAFASAVAAAQQEFGSCVKGLIDVWWPARSLVEKGFDGREAFHPSGKVIYIEEGSPWIEHLYDVEADHKAEGEIFFVIYPDWAAPGDYKIQCVPVKDGDFQKRLPLPSDLGGLEVDDLRKKSGIADLRFIHKALFIGGAHSLAGVVALAERALKSQ